MGKTELLASMSSKSGLTRAECEKALDAFADSVKDALLDGEKIMIKGFISIETSERKQRRGRNPKTGEVTTFPPTITVQCKIAQAIKDAVNER